MTQQFSQEFGADSRSMPGLLKKNCLGSARQTRGFLICCAARQPSRRAYRCGSNWARGCKPGSSLVRQLKFCWTSDWIRPCEVFLIVARASISPLMARGRPRHRPCRRCRGFIEMNYFFMLSRYLVHAAMPASAAFSSTPWGNPATPTAPTKRLPTDNGRPPPTRYTSPGYMFMMPK